MDKRPLCLLALLAWGGSSLCAQDPALELPTTLSAPEPKPAEPKPTQTPAAKSAAAEKPAPAKAAAGPNVVTKSPGASPAPVVVKTKHRTERVAFGERSPASTVTPTATPRRLSFFEFLFGPRKPKATPTPIPATPTPTPRPKKIRPKTTSAPNATPSEFNPPATPKPEPVKSSDTPKATPAKKITKPADPEMKATPAPKPVPAPPSGADVETQEKFHYNTARAKALEDVNIQKLKEKADTATTDEEARSAQRAYNKALFNKIRSLDTSVKERADRIESSLMKRLDEQ